MFELARISIPTVSLGPERAHRDSPPPTPAASSTSSTSTTSTASTASTTPTSNATATTATSTTTSPTERDALDAASDALHRVLAASLHNLDSLDRGADLDEHLGVDVLNHPFHGRSELGDVVDLDVLGVLRSTQGAPQCRRGVTRHGNPNDGEVKVGDAAVGDEGGYARKRGLGGRIIDAIGDDDCLKDAVRLEVLEVGVVQLVLEAEDAGVERVVHGSGTEQWRR